MGKTKAINARYVYAYLPSVETVNDWKARAKKSHVSISEFIFEHVSNSLRQEDKEEEFKPRAKLIEELCEKDEEIQKLTNDNEITRRAFQQVEAELRRYRAAPFLDDNFLGARKYDRQLIELLKKGEAIDYDHLLRSLRISPKESDLVKALSRQLENLQAYGLVRKTHHGWRWVAK